MGYVAVTGGAQAIEASIERLKYMRLRNGTTIGVDAVRAGMRALVDQVMSEASLYDAEMAALAIKQAEGSPEEAVFLMRAFRSTLPRSHYSLAIDPRNMRVERRISASFKEIPGGQILGASCDYTHRLIDSELLDETNEEAARWVGEYLARDLGAEGFSVGAGSGEAGAIDYVRSLGLLKARPIDDAEPRDVTKRAIEFPTSRSERLQILARGQTGAVTALGYAALRGYGATLHPTVGELRVGLVAVYVPNPCASAGGSADSVAAGESAPGAGAAEDSYYVGEIRITAVETLVAVPVRRGIRQDGYRIRDRLRRLLRAERDQGDRDGLLDQCLESGDKARPRRTRNSSCLHVDRRSSHGIHIPPEAPALRDLPVEARPRAQGEARKTKPMRRTCPATTSPSSTRAPSARSAAQYSRPSHPGYQVPFASREMPIGRGWGTGGIQITLSLMGRDDLLKVIDQGADSVNAVSIKKLVAVSTGIRDDGAPKATLIQSRHRIPEVPLREEQILVLQVPLPEPLRLVEPSEFATKRLHAEKEYSGAYLALFEEIMSYGRVPPARTTP